jgi:uncharacterized protein (DUF302 family)
MPEPNPIKLLFAPNLRMATNAIRQRPEFGNRRPLLLNKWNTLGYRNADVMVVNPHLLSQEQYELVRCLSRDNRVTFWRD